jgi:hypothetical protein
MKSDIDKFEGTWLDEYGFRLIILKETNRKAIVSILSGSDERPIIRPYYNNLPSLNMNAILCDYGSSIEVDLWKSGKGFNLVLTYEYNYMLDNNKLDSLVPAITRYKEDSFLEQYYKIFGSLKHFNKINAEPAHEVD